MSKQIQQSNQDQEAFIAVPVSLSQQPDFQEDEQEFSWASCGEACLLAILPCLLFIQFGVAYLTETPPQIHWMIVNLGIVCFIATAIIFRRTFSEPESLVALVPEVVIDVILGLILFEKTDIAATLMFASVIGMGAMAGAKVLCSGRSNDVVEERETQRGEFTA